MKEGDVIFLSASVPSRDEWRTDVRPAEIEEAIVSIARAVFSRRGRLLFGGHPSVSPLVAAVAGEYFEADPDRPSVLRPIVTFQSRFFEGRLPDETTDMVRMGWSWIEWTDAVRGANPGDPDPSLTEMRKLMLEGAGAAFERHKLRPPRAMIAVGGMEGISEEAAVFLDAGRRWSHAPPPRIFLLPSGGGAVARLLETDLRPHRLWPERLKPEHETMFISLREGVGSRAIVDAEAEWRRQRPNAHPGAVPFQPYAAIVQWLLDEQLDAEGRGRALPG